MSDKQRADHIQAKYWNGFITRTEAQKVFDEQMNVIMRQAQILAKYDAAMSCVAEKVGVTAEDVNKWIEAKVEAAKKAQENEQPTQGSENQGPEVSSLIAA